jgi:hypothetical protein
MTPATETVETTGQPELGLALLTDKAALVIRTAEDYETIADGLADNKGWQKRVVDWFEPMKRKAHEVHAAICEKERTTLAPAKVDEQVRKLALAAYDAEQDRIAAARQRQLEAKERQRQAVLRQQEEQRQLEEAAALETEANTTGDETLRQAAEDLVSAPVELPPAPVVHVEKATPKVGGLSYSDKWEIPTDAQGDWVGVDVVALCASIGRYEVPASYVTVNVGAINKVLQATKGTMKIPGVPVTHRRVPSSRARR